MKRVVFLAISLGYFLANWLQRVVCFRLGKRIPATAVVFLYHSVPKEKRLAFARQMDELIRWSKPIRADATMPLPPGARYAAVTFDDGYRNNIESALPELAQRGIPATLFIVTEVLGATPNWTDYYNEPIAMSEPIQTERQLANTPSHLVEIGSHTLSHPLLPSLPEQQARDELSRSRSKLQGIVKREVRLFSFPYGAFNDDLIQWCREAGYQRVFTTLPRPSFLEAQEFVVGRVAADPDDWILEFRLKLFGAYQWMPRAFDLKRLVKSKMFPKVREKAPVPPS